MHLVFRQDVIGRSQRGGSGDGFVCVCVSVIQKCLPFSEVKNRYLPTLTCGVSFRMTALQPCTFLRLWKEGPLQHRLPWSLCAMCKVLDRKQACSDSGHQGPRQWKLLPGPIPSSCFGISCHYTEEVVRPCYGLVDPVDKYLLIPAMFQSFC